MDQVFVVAALSKKDALEECKTRIDVLDGADLTAELAALFKETTSAISAEDCALTCFHKKCDVSSLNDVGLSATWRNFHLHQTATHSDPAISRFTFPFSRWHIFMLRNEFASSRATQLCLLFQSDVKGSWPNQQPPIAVMLIVYPGFVSPVQVWQRKR